MLIEKILKYIGYGLLGCACVIVFGIDGFKLPAILSLIGYSLVRFTNKDPSLLFDNLKQDNIVLEGNQRRFADRLQDISINELASLNSRINSIENSISRLNPSQPVNSEINYKAIDNKLDIFEKRFHEESIQFNKLLSELKTNKKEESKLLLESESLQDSINRQLEKFKIDLLHQQDLHIKLINDIVKNIHKHDIINNREESNNLLVRILGGEPREQHCNQFNDVKPVQKSLVMVCPWLTSHIFGTKEDKAYITLLIEERLKKGVRIEIGYGYLNDLNFKDKVKANSSNYLSLVKKSNPNKIDMHIGIEVLKELGETYSNLELKFIGDHSKYLICDDEYIVFNSHNFLSSEPKNYLLDHESGILTYEPGIKYLLTELYKSRPILSGMKPILKSSRKS